METTTQTASRTMRKGLLITVALLFLVFGIFESYQRVKNYVRWSNNTGTPYILHFETAGGVLITERGGSLLSVYHPHLIHRLKKNQRTPEVTVNAQGFRGRDWTMEGSSACRVVVLGGSSVFGIGASGDDKVFVNVLEHLLNTSSNSTHRAVEVLNAGVPTYDSSQELILLATNLLDYQPDVVILFDGWNDFYFGGVRPEGVREAVSPLFYEFDEVLSRNTRRWANALRVSAFFRRMERELYERRYYAGHTRRFVNYSNNLQVFLARYSRNLERMVRLAKAYGSETIIAPQPELFHRKGDIPHEEQEVRRQWSTRHQEGYEQFARAHYPAYIETARAVASAEGVPFLNAPAAFDEFDGVAFGSAPHFNDQGNRIIARFLLPTVSRALTRKASRSGCNATAERS